MKMSNVPQSTPQPAPSTAMVPARSPAAALDLAPKGSPFEMALEPADFDKAWQIAAYMGKIRYCGVQSAEEALSRIMYGRTLGLSAMAAMANVYTIPDKDGNPKPGIESTTMLGICLQRSDVCEYFFPVASSPKSATWRGKRRGFDQVVEVTFTIEDAQRAGLTGRGGENASKNNWDRYPEDMCNARAITRVARRLFPDLIRGFHSVEELRDAARLRSQGQILDEDAIDTHGALAETNARSEQDLAKQAAEIKAQIIACKTKDDFKAAHKAITDSDLPEAYVKELKDAYGTALKASKEPKPEAAPAAEEPKK
jgi:hypothetical protein